MRIVFMGSGQLACPALEALMGNPNHAVVAVVTQPDRPSGRRQHLKACPVRSFIGERSIPVLTPENVSAPGVVEQLRSLAPEIVVVADFGQFLKAPVLALPSRGTLNIHPSLLPKYRGAAPIAWAIAHGDTQTGVTIMHVNEQMDAGDIVLQETAEISDEDTTVTLEPRLAELGARLLVRALDLVAGGRAPRIPQDDAKAVLAPKLSKEDGRIDWPLPAEQIRNRVRGFVPWPCCYCEVPEGSGHRLKVLKSRVEERSGPPGIVLEAAGEGPLVACGDKALRLLEVQPEGKKAMGGAAYLCGHKIQRGDRFG